MKCGPSRTCESDVRLKRIKLRRKMPPKLAQLFHTRIFKEHGGKLTREERYPSLPLDNPVRMVPLKAISCEAARMPQMPS